MEFELQLKIITTTLFTLTLVYAGIVDAKTQRLPDLITLGGSAVCAILLLIAGIEWKDLVLGYALGAVFFFAVYWFTKGGIGIGDIKLSAYIGLVLGIKYWFVALLGASFTGLLFVGFLFLKKNATMKTKFPFGPFLSIGALAALILKEGAFL